MTCNVDDCERKAHARGWCHRHYVYWLKNGHPVAPPKPETCSISDCGRNHYGRGWCRLHWERWHRHGDPLYDASRKTSRICGVMDCESMARSAGFCKKHYQRLRRTGDPEGLLTKPLQERFWAKVDRRGPKECWEWRGFRMPDGYGRFSLPGKRHGRAHVYSYELTHGSVAAGQYILHACDNPPCVNPAHLSAGTQAENMDQMVKRSRRGRKLTDAEMIAIRDSAETQRALAKAYGISQSYVSLIKRQYRDGMNRSFTA